MRSTHRSVLAALVVLASCAPEPHESAPARGAANASEDGARRSRIVVPAAADTPMAGGAYVASSRGTVYYPVACDDWRRLAPANRRFFADAAAAEAAGYTRTESSRCAAVAGGGSAQGVSAAESGTCVVARIVDGDTLQCDTGERVRLLLVDSPELRQGRFGLAARLALEELLPAGSVAAVELDVQTRDRYGRILAYLHTSDGVFVNEALARRGYAVVSVYPPNVRHVERIRAAVAEARRTGAGLWAEDGFACAPAEHRAGRC